MNEHNPTLDLGSITINWLQGGRNQMDGGTMFGAVPKLLWSKICPPTEDNYLTYRNNPLLVRTPEANIIIDTGLGNKLSDKQRKIFRLLEEWSIIDDLAGYGLKAEDIDAVIFTHGDFDHAGGIVTLLPDGSTELTFPKARHIMQRREWEDISQPNIRAEHTYFPKNFVGLEASGLLELVDGKQELFPGIAVRHCGGHTRGHQVVIIKGSSGTAVHMGDNFPTHHHANPLWIMSYDNFPLDVIEQKLAIFKEFHGDAWFTFYHDDDVRACRLDQNYKVVETITQIR